MTERLDIDVRSLDDLEKYSDNPVQHGAEQLQSLKESIRKFGFKNPVIIDEDNIIVSGHARYDAVTELAGTLDDRIESLEDDGKDELAQNLRHINSGHVHVMVTDELTEEERKEFRIADNKVFEESEWDDDSLKFELRELETAVGFEDDEVQSILSTNRSKIEYDDGEVEDKKKRLEEKYKKLSDAKNDRKRGLPCPHCDSLMYLDAKQLRGALRRAQSE